ncbi:MAG: aspartyl protease family protein [Candidatus Eremiobacteraeota bacterium]|nr:aspartyl protease family protein [Candidatus Eremiobacteraeota bacterium]
MKLAARTLGLTLGLTLAAIAAIAASGVAARADDTPTPDELLARARVATGADRRPDAEREVWSIRVAGLEGTLETLRRGADTAGTTVLGPFRTGRGVWHGVRWHQNENGQTLVDRPEASGAQRVVTQTVLRERTPVDAWVLVTTYASGHVSRVFYDTRTYYLVRTERVAAGRTTHTTYDDFRTDARGRSRPWHYSGGDERPPDDFDYRLERDETPDIAEAEVAIPRDRRTLVEFPAGNDVVRLPARIADGRVYVRLTIAGRGLDFLLDTGASSLTINESVARQLRLRVYGRAAQTVAGTFETSRVIVPSVSIGGLGMRDVVMHTVPLNLEEGRDSRVVGLLGFDFLDAVALKMDYVNGSIDAGRPGTLAAPAAASPLDVRLGTGAPVARATIGNASGDNFILDTGAAFSYVLFQRFARAHPDAVTPSGDGRLQYGIGVGGVLSLRSVAAKKLALGASTFEDALGVEALSPYALGFDNEDGLIGAHILKQFTVYLDYAANRVYLAPPAHEQTALGAEPDRH